MIRRATIADQAAVVSLLRGSYHEAGFDREDGPSGFAFPFDPAYAERLFRAHFGIRRICYVHEVDREPRGVLMAAASEHPFGPVWIARETVWWIDPAHRGRAAVQMLDAYERWAAVHGCVYAGMAGMGDDPAVARLYLRRGYRPAERHFLKHLKAA